MRIKPESPRFRAVRSFLLRTHNDAVALPGKCVLLNPNLRMFVGHKFCDKN
jgi:hypothetical protein